MARSLPAGASTAGAPPSPASVVGRVRRLDSRRLARLSRSVGLLVAAAGLVFVAVVLRREWDGARDAVGEASPGWLLLAVALAAAGMVAIAVPWPDVLAALGSRVSRRAALAWYFLGEIGKYVPGGLWPVVGRAELARRAGVPRPAAYGSVALSLGLLYLACAAGAAAVLPFAGAGAATATVVLAVLAIPVGVVAIHPAVLGAAVGLGERVLRRPLGVTPPPWPTALGLAARYLPAWGFIAGATWAVARAFDPGAPVGRVALAAAVSWFVGFAAVPVPGGVGVREAVFLGLAATSLADGVAAATALVARLVFVAVDAAGAVVAATVLRRAERAGPPASVRTERFMKRSPRTDGGDR